MSRHASNPMTAVAFAAAVANSTPIPYKGRTSGCIIIPTTGSLATLTWYGSVDQANWYPLYTDNSSAAAAVTSKPKSGGNCGIPIPAACAGWNWIAATADHAVTGAIVTTQE